MQNKLSMATISKILLVLVTIVWGSSFVVLKDTLSTLGGGHFTFFILAARFGISSIVLIAICWKKFITISKTTLVKGLALGFILFCAYGVQTIGLRFTSASKNAFLTSVYVVLVPFLSWILIKIKPKPKHYVAACLCFVGISFVAVIGKNEIVPNELLGDLLSGISGVFYALQIVFLARHTREDDPIQLLIIELLVVTWLCFGISFINEFQFHYTEFSLSFDAIWKLLYLGLVCTLFAQFGQTFAQKYASAMSVAIIFSLEAVFGVFFDLIFSGVKLTIYIIIGFVFIFVGEIVSEVKIKNLINPIFKRRSKIVTESEKTENSK